VVVEVAPEVVATNDDGDIDGGDDDVEQEEDEEEQEEDEEDEEEELEQGESFDIALVFAEC